MSKVFLALMVMFALLSIFFLIRIDFVDFEKEQHLSPLLLSMSNGLFIVAMYVFYRNAKKKESEGVDR